MAKWISDGDWIYEISANGMECSIREYKGNNENIVVPEQCDGYPVTTLGNDVSCVFILAKVQTVILPSTVTKIASCAFLSCATLKEITLPAGLRFIGDNAFYGCTSLKNIELPTGISCIKRRTFCCCESLISLIIPSSVKEIEAMSFLGCRNLEQVTFSKGLKIIGHCVFYLTNLSEVVLPDSIIKIETDSFEEGVLVQKQCVE